MPSLECEVFIDDTNLEINPYFAKYRKDKHECKIENKINVRKMNS